MKKYLRPITMSSAFGAIISLLTLVIMSFILSVADVPQPLIDPMTIFAAALGAFIAGYTASLILREKGVILGFICGFIIFTLIMLASLTVKDNVFGMLAVIKFIVIIISGMLGGIVGVNRRKRHKKIKK